MRDDTTSSGKPSPLLHDLVIEAEERVVKADRIDKPAFGRHMPHEQNPLTGTAPLPRARLRYVPPDPKLVDLSFDGRLRPGDPSLAAITAASTGDLVQLIRDGDRWRIDNAQGQTLARLSRAFAVSEGITFLRGEVAAILNWRREDGDTRPPVDVDHEGRVHIGIGGLMLPPTARAREIVENDMHELVAKACQQIDRRTVADDVAPEVATQLSLTDIIEKSYENLTPDETEAIRQDLAARMNIAAIARRMAKRRRRWGPRARTRAGPRPGQPRSRTLRTR